MRRSRCCHVAADPSEDHTRRTWAPHSASLRGSCPVLLHTERWGVPAPARRPVHFYIKTRACTAGVQVVTWVSYARTRSKIRKLAGNRQNNRQRAYAPSVLLLFRTNTASAKPNTSKPRFAGKVI